MNLDDINHNYFLIVIGIISIIIEILLGAITGFDLLLIGTIFIISGTLGLFFNSLILALIAVVALSVLYMSLGRQFVKKRLSVTTTKLGTEALIGKRGKVTSIIHKDAPGQAKVDGEIWRAEAEDNIDEGSEVVVISVSGVTLKVKKI